VNAAIQWHYCVDQLPDDECRVLVAAEDGEIYDGWHDADSWFTEGVAGVVALPGVYAWAHVPAAPAPQAVEMWRAA